MLKKLVPALALTSLAFGSGLCFNPYNHDYGISTEQLNDSPLSSYNKIIVLHNGKMQLSKHIRIKLTKYITKGNKALMLMDAGDGYGYFVVYTECIHRKPITKDVEVVGDALGAPSASVQVVNLPKYPIKFGFYKDGFWVKSLTISWIQHLEGNGPGGYSCDYFTEYYSSKPIPSNQEFKDQYLPSRVCNTFIKN